MSGQKKQENFTITITADSISSTDERFTLDNIALGSNYKPLDAFLLKHDGTQIRRNRNKREQVISNQTLPRIACQEYENEIKKLSDKDKLNFPICQYSPSDQIICGIYSSVDEFNKDRKTYEHGQYDYEGGQFVFYSWGTFSTLLFVQECLKRFGNSGDKFILIYKEKDQAEADKSEVDEIIADEHEAEESKAAEPEQSQQFNGYLNPMSYTLLESKNIILHGAPGTGKTFLAQKIAADIISNGTCKEFDKLSDEQKLQYKFVQFHPSYDYTDFVEGMRPKLNEDGTMCFDLQDGIFKKFVSCARKNYEDSQKTIETIEKEDIAHDAMDDFIVNVKLGYDKYTTITGNEFYITGYDDKHIYISIPANQQVNKLSLNKEEIKKMLEDGRKFSKVKDITAFFGKLNATMGYSYDLAIYNEIKKRKSKAKSVATKKEQKKYIFVIDEINRGEISKIFGELFFSIEPSYRGKKGEISTQYANLRDDPNEKFYIPENVYIIGTMNDIDRSVDSFDFAMRRRFRFVELKANEHMEMLDSLESEELQAEAKKRMMALNKAIAEVDELNEDYQIGAAYFLKLNDISPAKPLPDRFDLLWTDHLEPLLRDYVHGMYDEKSIMTTFAKAYGCNGNNLKDEGDVNEPPQG